MKRRREVVVFNTTTFTNANVPIFNILWKSINSTTTLCVSEILSKFGQFISNFPVEPYTEQNPRMRSDYHYIMMLMMMMLLQPQCTCNEQTPPTRC